MIFKGPSGSFLSAAESLFYVCLVQTHVRHHPACVLVGAVVGCGLVDDQPLAARCGAHAVVGLGAAGFVGLKNFGCTCYMNALIQQLFMISDFRQGVLQSDVSDPDLDNSVLYQLKLIFANLQESEKQYYAPTGFTKAFKFFGEPVNVR